LAKQKEALRVEPISDSGYFHTVLVNDTPENRGMINAVSGPAGTAHQASLDNVEVVLQAVERRDVRVAAAPAGTRRRIRLVVRAIRAATTAPATARRCRRLLIRLLAEIVERGADQKDLR
jgi:hypothetical protein